MDKVSTKMPTGLKGGYRVPTLQEVQDTLPMNIHLRYFASLREIIGLSEEILTVAEGARVADVRQMLGKRDERLASILERCICAVNRRYVSAEIALQDNDELVFIPPMGGGGTEEDRHGPTHSPDTRSA